ncbi:heme lyase CcmF/NrfE family subunit [Thermaerobacter subterraneus]|uniref:Cytochrome c biogenesis factor n=1 Tax=Thermaerobacter subterraneus DSM 13965 TaxID=867903 RepID=K6QE63_9FIRM|nr:heme lyase CcmF/NrfE family subunit [Thermaerobacter subterraneus]EKP95061.1 cytochrome c biogenesis factor [Thermaerobacter subterraneus DSM 13965]
MANVGHALTILALALAVALAVWAPLEGRWRWRLRWMPPARWLAAGLFVTVSAAVFILVYALFTDDFSFRYVASQSSRYMPAPYKISALWSGQEGSLLFWLWLLSGYTAAVAFSARRAVPALLPYALATLGFVAAFFALQVAVVSGPFDVLPNPPADGRGMNPLLQNPWMVSHPLALYLGYVGMAVPFAFAMAALWTRNAGDAWIRVTRRWTLLAWLFLSVGILIGSRWAYTELGWGGVWAWDPVENAALMPWLLATAFIHSSLVQEKRGMLKRWNAGLVIFVFLLTIFGTFITRSGILSSVHAFVTSPTSPWFVGFLGLVLVVASYLFIDRAPLLADERRPESPFSKETGFLLNNLLLAGLTFAVFWGTVLPLVTPLFGAQVSVGPPFFNWVGVPLFLAMMILMGVAPVLAWRKASWPRVRRLLALPAVGAVALGVALAVLGLRELPIVLGFAIAFFVGTATVADVIAAYAARVESTGDRSLRGLWQMLNRNPRRYGGYVVHLGVVLIMIGLTGMYGYQQVEAVGLSPGESYTFGGFTITYHGLGQRVAEGVPAVYADLSVSREGREIGRLQPERRFYPGFVETLGATPEVAMLTSFSRDLYVVLGGWEGDAAGFEFYLNPLVAWIWIGGYLVVGGTLFSLWPRPALATGRARILAELAELEYDYRSGKIAAADYARLRQGLVAAAEAVLAGLSEDEARVAAEIDALAAGDGGRGDGVTGRRPGGGTPAGGPWGDGARAAAGQVGGALGGGSQVSGWPVDAAASPPSPGREGTRAPAPAP